MSNIIYRKTLNIPLEQQFGIELEFNGIWYSEIEKLYKKNKFKYFDWELEEEESFPIKEDEIHKERFGGEFKSIILNDTKETWESIKEICEFIKSNGGYINDLCGGHIHIDSKIFNKNLDNVILFLKMWAIYEDVIFYFFCGKEQRTFIERYSRPVSKSIICHIDEITALKNIRNEMALNRGACINFSNMRFYDDIKNTLELRCPNGTLDHITWQNNINFIMKFLLSINSCDKELIQYKFNKLNSINCLIKNYKKSNMKKAYELCDLVFDSNLDISNFMKQYTK